MAKPDNILLFGGTGEGRELTNLLASAGMQVCVSVATERGLADFSLDDPRVFETAGCVAAILIEKGETHAF